MGGSMKDIGCCRPSGRMQAAANPTYCWTCPRKVEEITPKVEGLGAHVLVLADLTDLVKLSVGADVGLDKVEFTIKSVEARRS